MEMIEIYIPENLQLHDGSIAAIIELHFELSSQMFVRSIDIQQELVKKAKELKEPKIAKFLEAI